MSRIIAIANQKGGVGKTTSAVNLCAALAASGKRVLLVDLDPQGNATMGAGIEKRDLTHSITELLLGESTFADALRRSEEGFDVIPGNIDLTAAEIQLMDLPQRDTRLKSALHPIRSSYDYILIDCPPSLSLLTLNALAAADGIIVPMQCEYYALEGLSSLINTINALKQKLNPELAIDGIIRTMYDVRNNLGNAVSNELTQHFGDTVFRTLVPRNVRLAEAPSHGMSIIKYDKSSRGALAYMGLAGEIIRRNTSKAKETN